MNLRYHLGCLPASLHSWLLGRPWFPLFRRFRGSRDWRYGGCRFAGTRDFLTKFDVSAKICTVPLELARFFPAAAIHAFEPMTTVFAELRRKCAATPRVTAQRLALSDAAGDAFLDPQSCSELNSLDRTAAFCSAAAERKSQLRQQNLIKS